MNRVDKDELDDFLSKVGDVNATVSYALQADLEAVYGGDECGGVR